MYLRMWKQYVVNNDYVLKWLICFKKSCLTRLYVVIVCDCCIILDGVLGTQIRIVLILSIIEGTYVVVKVVG